MNSRLLFAGLVLVVSSEVANAACWKLKDGTVVQTSSNSTPPASGAKRVMCSQNPPSPAPIRRAPSNPSPPPSQQVSVGVVESDKRADSRECVDYARSRVSSLPTGLFTIEDKRRIITPGAAARAGNIAIINVPRGDFAKYGHVAYVEVVSANSITISETNYGGRHYQKRTATGSSLRDAERQLNIIGYFQP